MQAEIAVDCPVLCDDKKSLIFRPAETFDWALLPVQMTDEFAGTRVDVDG